MTRDKIARDVDRRLVEVRVELAQAVADRHVRAHNKHDVREPRVALGLHLVQDRPGDEHRHHGRLPRAGRHLRRAPAERPARLRGHLDPLEEVAARLRQKDDRLGRLDLREEKWLLTTLTPPPIEQLERRPRDPRIALVTPRVHALADQIDVVERLPRAPREPLLRLRRLRIAIPVARRPTALPSFRGEPFLDPPVLAGLGERRAEDRSVDLDRAHGRVPNGGLSLQQPAATIEGCSRQPSIPKDAASF